MGKIEEQYLRQQQSHVAEDRDSSGLICTRCYVVLDRLAKEFNFKCVFVLIMGLLILLSGIFGVLPHDAKSFGYDAKEQIKLIASIQAYFRLEKPVSHLIPHIERLQCDINAEIGVHGAEVAILSMHQSSESNRTDVIFGVIPNPINAPINPVSLSVLRSSLIEVFLQQPNLSLTTSIFGQPSMFQVIKFQGGITVIPPQIGTLWEMPLILFNFTINNSISDVLANLFEFKNQLKFGLHLNSYENVYVQITNKIGSTKDPPVIVQASVLSDLGGLLPQRLKQLAQTITLYPAKNLGLDNAIFGKVKGISLSSFLKGSLSETPPSRSPAPSPELSHYVEPSSSPSPAPSAYSPLLSPDTDASSPVPSTVVSNPPKPCSYSDSGSKIPPSSLPNSPTYPIIPSSPPWSWKSFLPPNYSPLPLVPYASSHDESNGNTQDLLPPSLASP